MEITVTVEGQDSLVEFKLEPSVEREVIDLIREFFDEAYVGYALPPEDLWADIKLTLGLI